MTTIVIIIMSNIVFYILTRSLLDHINRKKNIFLIFAIKKSIFCRKQYF